MFTTNFEFVKKYICHTFDLQENFKQFNNLESKFIMIKNQLTIKTKEDNEQIKYFEIMIETYKEKYKNRDIIIFDYLKEMNLKLDNLCEIELERNSICKLKEKCLNLDELSMIKTEDEQNKINNIKITMLEIEECILNNNIQSLDDMINNLQVN